MISKKGKHRSTSILRKAKSKSRFESTFGTMYEVGGRVKDWISHDVAKILCSVIFIFLFFLFFSYPGRIFSRHAIHSNSTELKFTKKTYIGKIFLKYKYFILKNWRSGALSRTIFVNLLSYTLIFLNKHNDSIGSVFQNLKCS